MRNAVQRFDLGVAFGIDDAKGVQIEGRADESSPFIPKKIPDYKFRREVLSDVVAWLKLDFADGLLLVGPTGSGKTSVVTQVLNRLNLPAQRIIGHRRLEFSDFIGNHTLIDGDMQFVDGPLTLAMRFGHILIIDELDRLDPGTAGSLQTAIEEGFLSIPENGGEVVNAAPGFRVVATANTAGSGDRTGLYQSTMRQNAAFLDRFFVAEVGYPTSDQELPIIEAAAPGLPDWIRDAMVSMANEVRALFTGEGEGPQVELPMSTRTIVRWARLTEAFQGVSRSGQNPVKHALDRAFANRCEPETKVALHGIVDRVFGAPGVQ